MAANDIEKVALVTGSSSGIGEATVKLLAKRGYKVVITGSKAEKVSRVAQECAALSPKNFQVRINYHRVVTLDNSPLKFVPSN